ncbi:MAG: hypothetical protein IKI21_03240, partial [Oscillospiraceae bacterium]|nr:hypothetical protein [Oscillospiraceae bacterium]
MLVRKNDIGKNVAAKVKSDGSILLNRDCLCTPQEWAFMIAHCQLHLAFGHFDAERMPGYFDAEGQWHVDCDPLLWNMACDLYIDRFLADLKVGTPTVPPNELDSYPRGSDERALYEKLKAHQIDPRGNCLGTARPGEPDMIGLDHPLVYQDGEQDPYVEDFAESLAIAVTHALTDAITIKQIRRRDRMTDRAAAWFVDHYP